MSELNFTAIIWDPDDDPNGNVQHIKRHYVTMEEVEYGLQNPTGTDTSHSSDRPVIFGDTVTGRHLMIVYEVDDDGVVYPITAFDAKKRGRP